MIKFVFLKYYKILFFFMERKGDSNIRAKDFVKLANVGEPEWCLVHLTTDAIMFQYFRHPCKRTVYCFAEERGPCFSKC